MKNYMGLTGQVLISTPAQDHSEFRRSVVYLCQHDKTGAMGIVVNQPIDSRLSEIFSQLDIAFEDDSDEEIVLEGGPMQPANGFVLHTPSGKWRSSVQVNDEIAITTSKDILEAIGKHKGPQKAVVALGHAGWTPGQLEAELSKNLWLTLPVSSDFLFDCPIEERWQSALSLLGIKDISQLAPYAAHA